MKKLIDTLILVSISITLPLIFKPYLILSWPILVVIAAGLFLGLSQPAMPMKKKETNSHDRSSMILIVLGVMICFAVSVIEYGYYSNIEIDFSQKSTWIGLSLIILGFGFRYYSIRILGQFFTAKVEIQKGHELIQIGPYQYLRHPSYTGAWLGVLGAAVFLQSIYGCIACIWIYFPIYIYRIACEERALTQKFPDQYPDYQRKTWKMLPFIF